jgi:hypothetical protein
MAPPADLSMLSADLRIQSRCGQPGDTGNELGIGAYCDSNTPCSGNTICSNIQNDPSQPERNTFFCTIPCQVGSTGTCGSNASCVCENGLCGCAPDRCPRPGG